ncbi:thiamine biosynthesis protein ThiF [Sulfurimonas sp.]|uniref:thiamine biosynthesis protein ThiF n=1 Tax=Sulfurimonas sp. TaxID=2022749 RepID=UPI00356607FE
MTHGFDLASPLVCEGIVGDGCGGGRIFFIKDETLYAHDPITKENVTLLTNIKMPKKISKKACDIFIKCEDQDMVFNLSSMKLV